MEDERMNLTINHIGIELQKMELELKCMKCLNLLMSPLQLPCGDIFCSDCIATEDDILKCPLCLWSGFGKDAKHADHMENIVHIYKRMAGILDNHRTQRASSVDALATKTQSSKNTISRSKGKNQDELSDKTSGERTRNTHARVPFSWNLNTENSEIQVKNPEQVEQERIRDKAFIDQMKSLCPSSLGILKHSDHVNTDQRCEHSARKRLSTEVLDGQSGVGKEYNASHPKKKKVNTDLDD